MKDFIICRHCLLALKSRGEKVFTSENTDTEITACDLCGDEYESEELYTASLDD